MHLSTLDWTLIAAFFIISLAIGIYSSRSSGKNSSEFFLSGRNMPWWLLGISMVATTFSADTPNLVTDIVRKDGVAGNWAWWAFLLTGMLTVFVYARLWRRSGVLTDLEFYELRYSGLPAAFLRGFRAVYLGVFFNILVMATVCLAAIKIGSVLLGMSPVQTLLISSIVTVAYSTLGGFKGIILRPTNQQKLLAFYKHIRPAKAGWLPVIERGYADNQLSRLEVRTGRLPLQILAMFLGSVMVYAALFCVGFWLYGQLKDAVVATAVCVGCAFLLSVLWKRL